MSQTHCKSCGAELSGRFCAVCGEKVLTREDKSVKVWLKDSVLNLVNIDGKLILTLKELLFFPSRYALNYSRGVRVKYLKPLNLFLLTNVLYFLLAGAETFKTSLRSQMIGQPYSGWVSDIVEKDLASRGTSIEAYAPAYDQKTGEISKLILIVLVPVLGAVFFLSFNKMGLMLSEGFNLAFQFWAFFTIAFNLFIPALAWVLYKSFGLMILTGGNTDIIYSLVILAFSGLYIFLMMKPWKSKNSLSYLARIILIQGSFYPMILVYRFILFGLTFWLV